MSKEGCLAGLAITFAMSILARCRHVKVQRQRLQQVALLLPVHVPTVHRALSKVLFPAPLGPKMQVSLPDLALGLRGQLCGVLLRVKVYFEDSLSPTAPPASPSGFKAQGWEFGALVFRIELKGFGLESSGFKSSVDEE